MFFAWKIFFPAIFDFHFCESPRFHEEFQALSTEKKRFYFGMFAFTATGGNCSTGEQLHVGMCHVCLDAPYLSVV